MTPAGERRALVHARLPADDRCARRRAPADGPQALTPIPTLSPTLTRALTCSCHGAQLRRGRPATRAARPTRRATPTASALTAARTLTLTLTLTLLLNLVLALTLTLTLTLTLLLTVLLTVQYADVHPPGAQGHSDLFHPNSGASGVQGALDAVRHRQYKAVWQTGGAFGCGDGNRARPERFEPPLLFDLDADPQEATPLDPVTHAHVLVTVRRLRAAKEADIYATFRSVTYILRHACPTCATLALPVPR